MDSKVRLLGWLYIFYHGFSLLILAVVAFAALTLGLFSGDADGFVIGTIVACALIILGFVTALPGIIAGWGLLNANPRSSTIKVP